MQLGYRRERRRDTGYVSVDEMPDPSPKTRLLGCLGACVVGTCVIIGGFFCKEETDEVEGSGAQKEASQYVP
jgi:hypothetical protein